MPYKDPKKERERSRRRRKDPAYEKQRKGSGRRYREAHREELRKKSREYYKKNRERLRINYAKRYPPQSKEKIDYQTFIKLWNESLSVQEFAMKAGYSIGGARSRAWKIRKTGALKKMVPPQCRPIYTSEEKRRSNQVSSELWRKKHPEKVAEYHHRKYLKNRDNILARNRRWSMNHKDRRNALDRGRFWKDPKRRFRSWKGREDLHRLHDAIKKVKNQLKEME